MLWKSATVLHSLVKLRLAKRQHRLAPYHHHSHKWHSTHRHTQRSANYVSSAEMRMLCRCSSSCWWSCSCFGCGPSAPCHSRVPFWNEATWIFLKRVWSRFACGYYIGQSWDSNTASNLFLHWHDILRHFHCHKRCFSRLKLMKFDHQCFCLKFFSPYSPLNSSCLILLLSIKYHC